MKHKNTLFKSMVYTFAQVYTSLNQPIRVKIRMGGRRGVQAFFIWGG